MTKSDLLRLRECVEAASIRPAEIVGFKRIERPYVDADILLQEIDRWANELTEE